MDRRRGPALCEDRAHPCCSITSWSTARAPPARRSAPPVAESVRVRGPSRGADPRARPPESGALLKAGRARSRARQHPAVHGGASVPMSITPRSSSSSPSGCSLAEDVGLKIHRAIIGGAAVLLEGAQGPPSTSITALIPTSPRAAPRRAGRRRRRDRPGRARLGDRSREGVHHARRSRPTPRSRRALAVRDRKLGNEFGRRRVVRAAAAGSTESSSATRLA